MTPGIKLTKIWSDEDLIEFEIEIWDGSSSFNFKAYLGHLDLSALVSNLSKFKTRIHDGIFDIEIGNFGPEYAGGALHARLHFRQPGKLFITAKAQSDYREFSVMKVANEATIYITSVPTLLDEFITQLAEISSGKKEEALLQAV